ncbi:putative dehydrogenase [Nocardia sp. GAS34]
MAYSSTRPGVAADHGMRHGPTERRRDAGCTAGFAQQLDAFAAAVLRGEPVPTSPQDSIENMTVIDAIYRAAGMPLRQPS